MEKVIFNKEKNHFELYSQYDLNNIGNPEYASKIGNIDEVVDYKISKLLSSMVFEYFSKTPYKEEIEKLIYVSKVIKSKSKKSVFQFGLSNKTHYNLPESFRNEKFDSIIARLKGTFDKKRIGEELVDCPSWNLYEVIFVGSSYQCIIEMAFRFSDLFLNGEVTDCLISQISSTDELENVVGQIKKMTNPDILKLRVQKSFALIYDEYKEEQQMNLEEDDLIYDGWRELGEEEENAMDEETDGHWRWNID